MGINLQDEGISYYYKSPQKKWDKMRTERRQLMVSISPFDLVAKINQIAKQGI